MAEEDLYAPSIEWMVSRTNRVHSPPHIYQRLNDAINHPRSSVRDFARIIQEDQGLTARILQLANSPMFGYFGRVDSISRAVTIIGTREMRDLALAALVMKMFRGIPEELMSMTMFWRHSIACGIVARNLAIYLRADNVERFFVAGILHDLGQLVMCTATPETVCALLQLSRGRRELYFCTEKEEIGFDHAELGSELLRSWLIPESIAEPVGYHHLPGEARQFPVETAVVHLADIICQALEYGASAEWCIPPLKRAAWEKLGVPISMIEIILKQSEPQIEETFAILAEGK